MDYAQLVQPLAEDALRGREGSAKILHANELRAYARLRRQAFSTTESIRGGKAVEGDLSRRTAPPAESGGTSSRTTAAASEVDPDLGKTYPELHVAEPRVTKRLGTRPASARRPTSARESKIHSHARQRALDMGRTSQRGDLRSIAPPKVLKNSFIVTPRSKASGVQLQIPGVLRHFGPHAKIRTGANSTRQRSSRRQAPATSYRSDPSNRDAIVHTRDVGTSAEDDLVPHPPTGYTPFEPVYKLDESSGQIVRTRRVVRGQPPQADWRELAERCSPGPGQRPASHMQGPRYFGPLGTAPLNFPNNPQPAPPSRPRASDARPHVPKLSLKTAALGKEMDTTPSERIGSLFSQTAGTLSPRRLVRSNRKAVTRERSALGGVVYSTQAREARAESLLQREQRLNELYPHIPEVEDAPEPSSFLPLELFDDWTYESFLPAEWVERGELLGGFATHAFSRFYQNGKHEWCACDVISWDDSDSTFLIEFKPSRQQKRVKRLNLLFEEENEAQFHARVEAAVDMRAQAEATLRYYLFFSEADYDVAPLADADLGNIMGRVASPLASEPALASLVASITDEIKSEYTFYCKKAICDYEYRDPVMQEKLASLNLPPPPGEPLPAPASAVVQLPDHDFHNNCILVGQQLFFNPTVHRVLLRMFGRWSGLQNKPVVAFPLDGGKGPFEVEVFDKLYGNAIEGCLHHLRAEWVVDIVDVIQRELEAASAAKPHGRALTPQMLKNLLTRAPEMGSNSVYGGVNLHITDFDIPELEDGAPPGRRLLMLVNLVMASQLRAMLTNTVTSYVEYFSRFAVEDLPDSTFVTKTPKHPSIDGITEQFVSQHDFWSLYISRLPTMEPLFIIHLKVDPETAQLVFEPTLEELQKSVVGNFDASLDCVRNLHQINSLLSPGYTGPTHPALFMSADDPLVTDARRTVQEVLRDNLVGPTRLALMYAEYQYILDIEDEDHAEMLRREKRSLRDLRNMIKQCRGAVRSIQVKSYDEVPFNLILVDCSAAKSAIYDKSARLANTILDLVHNQVKQTTQSLSVTFDAIWKRLHVDPTSPEEWEELKQYCASCEDELKRLQVEIADLVLRVEALHDFYYDIPERSLSAYTNTLNWPMRVRGRLAQQEYLMLDERKTFTNTLREEQERFEQLLESLDQDVQTIACHYRLELASEINDLVTSLHLKLLAATDRAALFNSRERLFGVAQTQYNALEDVKEAFAPYAKLWPVVATFKQQSQDWTLNSFKALDHVAITKSVHDWSSTLDRLVTFQLRGKTAESVARSIKEKIDTFKTHLPLLNSLRSLGADARYWNLLCERLPADLQKLVRSDDATLPTLISQGMKNYLPDIVEVAELAANERDLEHRIESMRQELKGMRFDMQPYKRMGARASLAMTGYTFETGKEEVAKAYIVHNADEVLQILDDQLIRTQSMRASPFMHAKLEGTVTRYERKLSAIQELLDEWLLLQRQWIYLDPIFGSEDIMEQMPMEGRKFLSVDETFRKNMAHTYRSPTVTQLEVRYHYLEQFKESNAVLEQIQRNLEEYLEKKCLAFPRFYFLSTEELLEILSHSKEPLAVQGHLKKCFENIKELNYEESSKTFTGMRSSEGEEVLFVNPVVPLHGPEVWLKDVEKAMRESLKDVMRESLEDALTTNKDYREKWVLSWPGQIVLAVSQVMWTMEVELAIQDGTRALAELLETLQQRLQGLVRIVRGNLTFLDRCTLQALITLDVHARDVVQTLLDCRVPSVEDFDWLVRLRYYWEDEQMFVRMVTATCKYAYEYLGNTSRLVVTPLTDRCYVTLMSAISLNLGGAPEGPAGTGKTETCKDLAKAIGKQCVVFNCSESLNYKAMGKMFKGIASSGAWACFDEFNRIDIEVLSVIASQVLTIQQAIVARKARFTLEGQYIALDPTCCIFTTMNPGYAGRTELPDNLKALFRPVAMMVPNYAKIAEIVLISYGFSDALALAKKVVATFRLSSEQLSAQDHYDFGLRAVKTVLGAAGLLRGKHATVDEDKLVLQALSDCNLPKFLSNDVVLFQGILADLFPRTVPRDVDYGDLLATLKEVVQEDSLQPEPAFLAKCIQLYETAMVRHGLMIVGETLSGKSTCIRMLARALTKMYEAGLEEGAVVETYTCNPKAISMGQLYGLLDVHTHEWDDGILSRIVRRAAADESDAHKWIILDGPVDSLWIESMNTVLDDNKKLCLTSGEIIKLSPTMTMMFEVRDLAEASPATVSRCGMVYTEPAVLPWQALVATWVATRPPALAQHTPFIMSLAEWLIPECLAFFREHGNGLFPTPDQHLVHSFLKMLQALTLDFSECDDMEEEEPSSATAEKFASHEALVCLEPLFVFSLIWSIGTGTVDPGSRELFSDFLRDLTDPPIGSKRRVKKAIPRSDSVYDYVFNKERNRWMSWSELPDLDVNIAPNTNFHEIVIPTVDTVRTSYLLSALTKANQPTLLVGPTGTGKTLLVRELVLNGLPEGKWQGIFLNFSAQTSANQTQDIIEGDLLRRRKTIFEAQVGKRAVIFVDDLNMPLPDEYGSQPPIELLRQYLDSGGWYDRKAGDFTHIKNVVFVAAMGLPDGRPHLVTTRLLRHFNVLSVPEVDNTTLHHIYRAIGDYFAPHLAAEVHRTLPDIISATIRIHEAARDSLLPTPRKSHYTFNLRDVAAVVQGVLTARADVFDSEEKILRLWAHECIRTYQDRLCDEKDIEYFGGALRDVGAKSFKRDWKDIVPENCTMMYGPLNDFGSEVVDEVKDVDKALYMVQSYLERHNSQVPSKAMDLVMFPIAIDHLMRVFRVITRPFGHALLVGVGGSGRQSLARLASFIAGYSTFEIEVTNNYSVADWHDHVKQMLMKAGLEGEKVVFLVSDAQIVDETFLEDISHLLNNGFVPNLFDTDDMKEIVSSPALAKMQGKGATSHVALFQRFIAQCKQHVHVVLCLSPYSSEFRSRLRRFPSLVNCCTIDWYWKWPETALVAVAESYLADVVLDDGIADNVTELLVKLHAGIGKLAAKFEQEQRRSFFVSSTHFLELIAVFKMLLSRERAQKIEMRRRYETGIEKLHSSTAAIEEMKDNLDELRPKLEKASEESDKLMARIEEQKGQLDTTLEVEKIATEDAQKKADVAQEIRDECERDLSVIIPTLKASVRALQALRKEDIAEMKAMKNPPPGVKKVMEAVCILRGVKPKTVIVNGFSTKDYWISSKRILGETRFLRTLMDFDPNSPSQETIAKIEKKTSDPEFQPEHMQRVSVAAASIATWVRAIERYHKVTLVVRPKKQALEIADAECQRVQAILDENRAQLQAILAKTNQLKAQYEEQLSEKQQLEQRVTSCEVNLDRARRLITRLAGARVLWRDKAASLAVEFGHVVGDMLVCAASIVYLGPLTHQYRAEATQQWLALLASHTIPFSEEVSLRSALGSPLQIQKWHVRGLPTDGLSIDNAIIATSSRAWPLMIDPQGQAKAWIQNAEADNRLTVLKPSDERLLMQLERSIEAGTPCLLDGVGERLDPALTPLLNRATYRFNGRLVLKLRENPVTFHSTFRLYITTQLQNPMYPPEVSTKVNVLNFAIAREGLEDQMLNTVVGKEFPMKLKERDKYVSESVHLQARLQAGRDLVLEQLSNAEGNFLEDEVLINTLTASKVEADELALRLQGAEEVSRDFDKYRAMYQIVGERAALLFFCVLELAHIDPMYRFSLASFRRLFENTIESTPPVPNREQRLEDLREGFTQRVYRIVCRSLFSRHKMLFSLIIALRLDQDAGKISEDEYRFLLTGLGPDVGTSSAPNPAPTWIDERMWKEVRQLEKVNGFEGLAAHISANLPFWRKYCYDSNPETTSLSGRFGELCDFQRLMLVRCMRPDKVVIASQMYVSSHLGDYYVDPPRHDLLAAYHDSSPGTPLVFVLSPGMNDPYRDVAELATRLRLPNKVVSVSLGQDQGQKAQNAIMDARQKGVWVLLQNCHLAASWMPSLADIADELGQSKPHRNFRLWLTSMPSPHFPVAVLQNSVKMTNEAPNGLRANLNATFHALDPDLINPTEDMLRGPAAEEGAAATKAHAFKKMVFALAFFHAVVQERRKFGPLGWNVPYEFTVADFAISMRQLEGFMDRSDMLPLKALKYLTGEVNYGGRVTDEHDRRLLRCLLEDYYCHDTVEDPLYNFRRPSTAHGVPPDDEHAGMDTYLEYIKALPLNDDPSAFGMHNNADVTAARRETSELLGCLRALQPRTVMVKKGGTHPAVAVAETILAQLPEAFDIAAVQAKYPTLHEDCISSVLVQEVARYSKLIGVVRGTLLGVQRALAGLIVMSDEYESMAHDLSNDCVPPLWKAASYPTEKALQSYVDDLEARLAFIQKWVDEGAPRVFWFPGLYFPQAFITAIKQNTARRRKLAVDSLKLVFSFVSNEQRDSVKVPLDGCLIDGLYLEGARFDMNAVQTNDGGSSPGLIESRDRILYCAMPMIRVEVTATAPRESVEFAGVTKKKAFVYHCPVYKTPRRLGVLATTGHSTNFVLTIDLPSATREAHWVKRGVALLCALAE